MMEVNIIATLYLFAAIAFSIWGGYGYKILYEKILWNVLIAAIFCFALYSLFNHPKLINFHGRFASLCSMVFLLAVFDGYCKKECKRK